MDKIGKILYPSHFEAFRNLTDFQVAQLIHKIGDDTYELTDPKCQGLWMMLERDFVIQAENYEKKAQANRENGKKGGRPNKPTQTQGNPENPLGFSETQHNPKNLKDRDKDIDNVFTSKEVKTIKGETNGSNDLLASLGGYGKFLGNFPPNKVRDIEEGKKLWELFSQEEKQEIFRHSTKYIQEMRIKNQEQYIKNSYNYLTEEMWLEMKPRPLVKQPVQRGMKNMTFISFWSKYKNISQEEAEVYLYRTSTDEEFVKANKLYQDHKQQLFNS